MGNAAYGLHAGQRKSWLLQLALLLAAAGGLWLAKGWAAGIALIFGALIVIANGRLQRWQLQRAARIAGNDPAKNMRYLYRCAVERFIATVALFAAGLGLMALPPLPLLSGYFIAQGAVIYEFYKLSKLRRQHG